MKPVQHPNPGGGYLSSQLITAPDKRRICTCGSGPKTPCPVIGQGLLVPAQKHKGAE
jgi:hypothetical protein